MSKKTSFTLSQLLALDIQRNIAVTAGAGAGKTAVLTKRLINILHNPEIDITEALVVTFTDKAAGEMKERVYKAIEERISIQDNTVDHWKRLKENFLLNNISTFHSFCAGVLKKYSVEANIDPNFRIVTDFEQRKLLGDAISSYVNRVASTKNINQAQNTDETEKEQELKQRDIKEDRQYLKRLISVWPRKTILNNINYLINIREDSLQWVDQFCDLNREKYFQDLEVFRKTVLYKIFTSMMNNPAFHTIFTRIANAVPDPPDDEGQLSQRRVAILSIYKTLTETSTEDIDRLVELCRDLIKNIKFSGSTSKAWKNTPENFGNFKTAASQLKVYIEKTKMFTFVMKKPLEEEGYQILRALARMTRACFRQYQEEKEKRQMMDFADLQLKVSELLRAEQYPHIRTNIRQQFRYIMVDEFQDTNNLQWEIIREIASDEQGLMGDKLFIVGDEKQAVYSFRGGDVTVFSKVKKAILQANRERGTSDIPFAFNGIGHNPEMSDSYQTAWNSLEQDVQGERKHGIVKFEENFRTAQFPISIINNFFHRLFSKQFYEEFEAKPQALICKGNLSEGSVELLLVEKESIFDEDDSNAWEIASMDNYLKEAHLIARKIKEILISEESKFQRTRESIAEGKPAIAILLNRRTKIKVYEEALRRENIDFRVHKGKGFYQRQEIMDIANVLEFLADRSNEISLTGFLRSPLCGLSDDGLMTLCRLGKEDKKERPRLWEVLSHLEESGFPNKEFNTHDSNALSLACRNLNVWYSLQDRLLLSEMIRRIIDDSGYVMTLARGSRGDQSMANVEKLIEQAREFEKQESTRIFDFVQFLGAQIDESENEGEADIDSMFGSSVQLMTVHQSKGLEFPVVFVPDMSASFNYGHNLPVYKDYIEYNPRFADHPTPENSHGGISKIFHLGIKAPDEDEDFHETNTLLRNIIFKMNVDKIRSERKRLLYVAMTRAMDHLYLVGQIKSPSSKQLALDPVSTFDDYNNWSEWVRLIFGLNAIGGMTVTTIQNEDGTTLKIPVTVFGLDDTLTEYTETVEVNAAELHNDIEALPDSETVRSVTVNLSEIPAQVQPEMVREEGTVYSALFSGRVILKSSLRKFAEDKVLSIFKGEENKPLYLCPDTAMPDTIIKSARIHSVTAYPLDEFVHCLYKRFGDGKAFIEKNIQEYIVAEVMKESADLLSHYSTGHKFQGIVRKFHQLLVKLNENGFVNLSGELKQALNKPTPDPAEQDLVVVFEKYHEYLEKHDLIDRESEYSAVHDLLRTGKCGEFFHQYKTVILDRFYNLSSMEKGIIREVITVCPNLCITLDHGADIIEKSFAITEDYRAFIDLMAEMHSIKTTTPANEYQAEKPVINFNIAVSRNEEIRTIAFSIRKLMLSSELKPSDITVAFPDSEVYSLLIRDQFRSYGIPYRIAKGVPLINHQVANLLLKLADVRVNQYQREKLFGAFSSGLISFHLPVVKIKEKLKAWLLKREISEELIEEMVERQGDKDFVLDIFKTNDILKKAGIMFGSNIDIYADRIILYLERQFQDEKERDKHKISMFTRIFILGRVFSLLNRFQPTLTVEKFREAWLDVISGFAIRENIQNANASLEHVTSGEKSFLLKRDLSILSSVEEILNKISANLGLLDKKGKKSYALNYLIQLFQKELREMTIPCGDEAGVRIIAMNELPGHLQKALYLGGLADGEFPSMPDPQFILSTDKNSSVLQNADPFNEGRYLFSYGVRNCGEMLNLSWPKSDSGKTLLVSPFIPELIKLGRVDRVEEGFLTPQRISELFSERDALAFFTRNIEENPESALPVFKALYKKFPAFAIGLIKIAEIESRRESFRGFGPYDGLVNEEKNLGFLKSRYSCDPDKGHYYTIPHLDRYAQCPMNYFFREVLGLSPVNGFLDDYENSEKGKLTHKILENFHNRQLDNLSEETVKIEDEEKVKLEKLMRETAEANIGSFDNTTDNMFRISEKAVLIRGLGEDCKALRMPKGTLKAFLDFENKNKNRSVPYKLDFVFGRLPENDSGEKVDADEDFLYIKHIPIAGRIDRIDLSYDKDYLVFMDYRIGLYPIPAQIGKGLSFQLPVHLMALKKHAQSNSCQVGAGGYFQIRSPKHIKQGNWFGLEDIRSGSKELKNGKVIASRQRGYGFFTQEGLQDVIKLIEERIIRIDSAIKQGKFHLPLGRNDDLPCEFCDYSGICRKEQLRLEKIYDHIDENEYYKPLRYLRTPSEG